MSSRCRTTAFAFLFADGHQLQSDLPQSGHSSGPLRVKTGVKRIASDLGTHRDGPRSASRVGESGSIEPRQNVSEGLKSQALVEWPHVGIRDEQDPPNRESAVRARLSHDVRGQPHRAAAGRSVQS